MDSVNMARRALSSLLLCLLATSAATFDRLCYDLGGDCSKEPAEMCARRAYAEGCARTCGEPCMGEEEADQWISARPEYPLIDVGDPLLTRSSARLGCNQLMRRANESHVRKLVQVSAAFASKLYHELNADHSGTNWVASPLSALYVLNVVYQASAGQTRRRLRDTVFATGDGGAMSADEAMVVFRLLAQHAMRPCANDTCLSSYTFFQKGKYVKLDQSFKDDVLRCFAVDATKLSRKRFDRLNAIVERYSKGYMKNVFDTAPHTDGSGVWLMNFLYLIAAWDEKFVSGAHKRFTFADGSDSVIPMMVSTAEYPYYESAAVSLVGIPTARRAHTVYFAAPKAGRRLDEVERAVMRPEFLANMHKELSIKELKVYMPQFQIPKSKFDLLGPLRGMGMDFASPPADFGRNVHSTVGNAEPALTHFIQMAQVMVNNQGIAAQANSVAAFELISRKQLVIMDRPYLFFVVDNFSGTVLFMGRVVNPQM